MHYFTPRPWPLTLNICSVSSVTWWNSVPNLNLVTSFQQPGYLADLISPCDHPHRSFCQFRRTTWTLLLVVSLLLLRNSETLFPRTVELLHPLTHLRSVLRYFSLIRHNRTVACVSILWRNINWLIDWTQSNNPRRSYCDFSVWPYYDLKQVLRSALV